MKTFINYGLLSLNIVLLILLLCSPLLAIDSDSDGMDDQWEAFHHLDTNSNEAALNYDTDLLDNLAEYQLGTDPWSEDTDRDGFFDDGDSNAISRMYIDWGNVYYTGSNAYIYAWPDWAVSASDIDGEWDTNIPAWHVSSAVSNDLGSLLIDFDRLQLTNDIVMTVNYFDTLGSSLYIDLFNTGGIIIDTNLYGNIIQSSNAIVKRSFVLPLEAYTNAVGVMLRRGTGDITVYNCLLYIDKDGDNLDRSQEQQLGTDPNLQDTDGDGLSDYTEVFITHTDPLLSDTDGDGLSDGDEVNIHGTNPLASDTDNDGLNDNDEINIHNTNPNNPDSDGDGLTDGSEVMFGRNPNVFDSYSHLVFQELFETNTVVPGELNGQHNWTVSVTNAAFVQTNFVYDGSQSLKIANPDNTTTAVVSQIIVATNDQQIWFDMMFSPEDALMPEETPTGIASLYFFNKKLIIYDGISENWLTITNYPAVTSEWVRITIMADFPAQRWLVALDGTLLADNIGFASYCSYATALSFSGTRGAADNITISRNMPGDFDLDNDGLTATEELAAGSNPLNADSDNDGMGDGAEVRWGFPANQTNTYFRLDTGSGHDTWFTGFEPDEGYQVGSLQGQNGWIASSNVNVSASNSYSGIQSVSIPESGSTNLFSMKGRFGTHGRDRVWVSLYIQPAMYPPPDITDSNACSIAVYDNRIYAYDGLLQNWKKSNKVFNIGSNDWVRIDILADFNQKMYLICLNGVLALEDVSFNDLTINELTALSVSGSGIGGGVWVDDIMLSAQEPSGALDFDADGLNNAAEYAAGTDIRLPDTDGDGVTDYAEITTFNTDPLNPDSDNDGIPDGWELAHNLDPNNAADGALDPDNDGLTNAGEYTANTDPLNPDTDGDTLTDGDEVNIYHTDPTSSDPDADGMPDPWEVANGTNPNLFDANADPDGDGLLNIDEYHAGTDPLNPDTDSDGVNDFIEVTQAFSDPLTADFNGSSNTPPAIITIATLDGSQTTNYIGSWTKEGNTIYARERSGSVSYTVTIPSNGIYILEFDVTQHNPLTVQHEFDLTLSIDGTYSGRQTADAPYGVTATAAYFLPLLDAGSHTATIRWRNLHPNTFLQITALRLQTWGGLDANTNGISDWQEHRIANMSGIETDINTTIVSPICYEGYNHYQDLLIITAQNQTWPVNKSLGEGWYSDIPLSATNATVITVSDQNGAVVSSNTVIWSELNLLNNSYTNGVLIRKNDSLLLTAYPTNATNGTVTIQLLDAQNNVVTNVTTDIIAPFEYQFDTAGKYTINGSYSNTTLITNSTLAVDAVYAAFADNEAICVVGQERNWDCPAISDKSFIQYDEELIITTNALYGGGTQFTLLNNYDTAYTMIARLLDENGPILDSAKISSVYGDNGNYWRVIETFNDGSRMVEARLQLGNIPPDLVVKLHIFKGGVTFDDGTIDRTLTAADFDELGVYTYRMIQSQDSWGSTCHTIKFYQNNNYIGGR